MRILETTAIYEEGVLKPEQELEIPEHQRVKLRIEVGPEGKKTGKYSIMDLAGVGKEVWEGLDAQEYVREERRSWER